MEWVDVPNHESEAKWLCDQFQKNKANHITHGDNLIDTVDEFASSPPVMQAYQQCEKAYHSTWQRVRDSRDCDGIGTYPELKTIVEAQHEIENVIHALSLKENRAIGTKMV